MGVSDISGTVPNMTSTRSTRWACAVTTALTVITVALLTSCAVTPHADPTAATSDAPLDLHVHNGKASLSGGAPRCGREFGGNGTVGPITCANGRVNAAVFTDVVAMAPRLFSLPRTDDWRATLTALCADYNTGGTYPILTDAYTYRYTADRWSQFSDYPSPSAFGNGLVDGTYCS